MTPDEYRLRRPAPFQFNLDAADRRRAASPDMSRDDHIKSENDRYWSDLRSHAAAVAKTAAPNVTTEDMPPDLPLASRAKAVEALEKLGGESISRRAVALEMLPDHHYRGELLSLKKDVLVPVAKAMLKNPNQCDLAALNSAGDILLAGDARMASLPPFGDGSMAHNMLNLVIDPGAPFEKGGRSAVAAHFLAQSRQMGRFDRQLDAQVAKLPKEAGRAVDEVRLNGQQARYFSHLESFEGLDEKAFPRAFTAAVSEVCGHIQAEEEAMSSVPGSSEERRWMRVQTKTIERGIEQAGINVTRIREMSDRLLALAPMGGGAQVKLLAARTSDQQREARLSALSAIFQTGDSAR